MKIEVDSKKELILNTALSLLAKNGFAKTTLDDIASALGMKKSSLYYYYQNKDALLQDVIDREQQRFCNMLSSAVEADLPFLDKLIKYETVKFNIIADHIKLFDINTSLLLELKSRIFEKRDELQGKDLNMLKGMLDEAVRKKEIVKCDTYAVARNIITISSSLRHNEFYHSAFLMNYKMDFDNALEEMIFNIKMIFAPILTNKKLIKETT